MGWWDDLFGGCSEPRPRPVEVITDTLNGYLPLSESGITELVAKYQALYVESLSKGDVLVYKGMTHKISNCFGRYSSFMIKDCNTRIYLNSNSCTFMYYIDRPLSYIESEYYNVFIPDELQTLSAWQLLQDFINLGELKKSGKLLVREKLKIPLVDERFPSRDIWHSVNNGEYYIFAGDTVYKFEDWSYETYKYDKMWEFIKDKDVVKVCEDPAKTHWKHFMKLEAIQRSKHDQELREWVDSVLLKKVEYDNLNLEYNNLPSAPIVDANSFMNFCRMVHEDVIYRDCEIENYIMIIRSKNDVEDRNV